MRPSRHFLLREQLYYVVLEKLKGVGGGVETKTDLIAQRGIKFLNVEYPHHISPKFQGQMRRAESSSKSGPNHPNMRCCSHFLNSDHLQSMCYLHGAALCMMQPELPEENKCRAHSQKRNVMLRTASDMTIPHTTVHVSATGASGRNQFFITASIQLNRVCSPRRARLARKQRAHGDP